MVKPSKIRALPEEISAVHLWIIAVQKLSGNEERWIRAETILNQSLSALDVSETSTRVSIILWWSWKTFHGSACSMASFQSLIIHQAMAAKSKFFNVCQHFFRFFHNDYRAFDNNFQKIYILGFRLIIVSHWCPTLPDFAGFGMHFNFTDVPYHYYDDAKSFKHVHSAKNEVCGIFSLQKCGYIGSDLTRNISDSEKFCA